MRPGGYGMNYADLIAEAWRLTWRHRFLWVLGLFAGGALGSASPMQWRGGPSDLGQLPPAAQRVAARAADLVASNVGLVVAAVGIAALMGLALLVVSLVARGAVVRAAADLEEGRSSSLRLAWRIGRRLFWRYVRLGLVMAGLALAVGLVLATGAVLFFAPLATGRPASALVGAAVALAVPVVMALVIGGVALSIVLLYAQRAIAIDDVGAVDALRMGWRTLRGHVGASLAVWAISLGLGVLAGLVFAVGLVTIAAVVGAIGFGLWALMGLHALTVAYAVVGGLAVVAAGATLAAIENTFFWNYWTIAYMRLHGPTTVPAAAAS